MSFRQHCYTRLIRHSAIQGHEIPQTVEFALTVDLKTLLAYPVNRTFLSGKIKNPPKNDKKLLKITDIYQFS